MPITNPETNTRIDELTDGIFRISTPVPPNPALPGGFTFNQFLVVDEDPLLFHTGPRRLFPLVREAVASVMPVARLRWVAYSHHEADENGSLAEWLELAPRAEPLCSQISALVNAGDLSARTPRGLADGETVTLGKKTVRWLAAPHVPHGWDAGYLFESTTRTLFCGDLFTQPGAAHDPVTGGDILTPSEAMRAAMDYYSNPRAAAASIERLATTEPALLACMHGASYRGAGAQLLRELGQTLAKAA
jgi:flavorubredoxin